ncbi:MAG: cobalamin biosynthesis central domain-containing protein [Anaeromassilibacillus sp.]
MRLSADRRCTGAQAAVTTATDGNDVFAVDTWAADQGFLVVRPNAAKAVSAALLNGEPVGFHSDFPVEGTLPKGIVPAKEGKVGIRISLTYEETFQTTCWLLPRILTELVAKRDRTDQDTKAVDSTLQGKFCIESVQMLRPSTKMR